MTARDMYILGPDGEPVAADYETWGRWFENINNRRVAYTPVGAGYVSTVFLGLDHSWGEGPPVLWETMTFGVPGLDETTRRSSSRRDALAAHDEAVAAALLAIDAGGVQ